MAVSGVSGNQSSNASSSATNSSNGMNGMDTTFLQMLITELKTQDPTSPMDPTQMVGQMISLNQLQQLVSINQLLQQSPLASQASTTGTNGGK